MNLLKLNPLTLTAMVAVIAGAAIWAALQLGRPTSAPSTGISPDRMIPNADVETFSGPPPELIPNHVVEQRARKEFGDLPAPMTQTARAAHRAEMAQARARMTALRQQYKLPSTPKTSVAAAPPNAASALSK